MKILTIGDVCSCLILTIGDVCKLIKIKCSKSSGLHFTVCFDLSRIDRRGYIKKYIQRITCRVTQTASS